MASSRIFYPVKKPLGSDGLPTSVPERVIYTRGLWSNSSGELTTFYTSSTQNSSSKQYYYEVWSSASLTCGDGKMFSVAYGHIAGSGSLSQGGDAGDTPSRAIYSQYKLTSLDPGVTRFELADGTALDDIYVVNLNRDKVGDKLDPGNFELPIAVLDGASPASVAGTGVITLIDDSGDSSDSLGYGGVPSPVRNLVSGSIANGIYNPSAPVYYGLVYADTGTIIISADMLDASASFGTVVTSNTNGDNALRLFTAISGASATHSVPFTARAVDVKEQDFYFVRVENGICNYTNNPTYVSGSDGFLANSRFENEPTSYITSIGLYNDFGELLAVAKMSQPIKKNFNSELSITVKLEY